MEMTVAAKGLCKSYGHVDVVQDFTVNVTKGSIYGLLGPNGAGKTTIFKMLSGLISPTAGQGAVFGLDIVKNRTDIQGNIGTMIDVPVFYEDISAAENLKLHLAYMGKDADVGVVLKWVGLTDTGRQAVSKFSLGMRQRLAIARAIIHKPNLLILDEPTNGLDPAGIRQMRELFVRLSKEQGMTILISSHILTEIQHICDLIGMIAKGRIISEDTMADIKDRQGGLEAYYMETMEG